MPCRATRTPRTTKPGRFQVLTKSFILTLALMLLWAMASPLASVPDEPSHAIRAYAVAHGELSTTPWNANPTMGEAHVPRYVAHMHERTCYAFQPDLSAGCVQGVEGNASEILITGTSAAVNHPAYYAIVGLPTLLWDGDLALYAMRGVSAGLSALFIAIMFMQLSTLRRSRWAILAAGASMTPMVLYLGGSINPNGLEVAAAGALLATLIAALREPSSRTLLWERAVLVTLSASALVISRSISLLWILVILGVALALSRRHTVASLARQPAAWVALTLAGLASFTALVWYANPPIFAPQHFAGSGTSPLLAGVTTLLATFDYAGGYVGLFGWVDTPSPVFSVIVWSAAIGAIIVAALAFANTHWRLTIVSLILVVITVPVVVQAIVTPMIGYIWQGRYMLAIVLCTLVVCGVALDDQLQRLPHPDVMKRIAIWAVGLLALGHIASFVGALQRYVVGANHTVREMIFAPQWQPPLGWSTLAIGMAVTVTCGACLVWRYWAMDTHAADGDSAPTYDTTPAAVHSTRTER